MGQAAAIAPSRRNLYYVGVAAYRRGLYRECVALRARVERLG